MGEAYVEAYLIACGCPLASQVVCGISGKEPAYQYWRHETGVQSLDQEDLLEEDMVTHSSILAWRIPWTEEPYSLQSTGSQTAGHN